MHEYVGSIHLHTTASDGNADFDEVAHLASQAGLEFVMATDHNVLVTGKDGWYGDLLLLVGEEIHDIERLPEANHYLAFNIKEEVAQHAKDAQVVIDAVNAQGGFGFLAHPFEHSTPFSGEPEIDWVDWQVKGYAGLEIWNYMSEFKAYLPNDVHATVYTLGPLKRAIHSYEHCFRTVRTHILSPQPFNGQLEHDRNLVYEALKTGHTFVAYDLIGDTRGFRFLARCGNDEAIMGEEIALEGEAEFEVVSPLPALLRLVHRGKIMAQKRGQTLRYRAREKGAYRVEAYRHYLLRRRGWVFTNPIYIL